MAYREELTLKARGLYTYVESLGSAPEGSLREAVNIVLDKTNIISPRRGYEALPGTISGTIGSLHSYTDASINNTLIAHRNSNTLSYYDDNTSTWTNYSGTYAVPSSSKRIRSVESNKNFYFTTSKGVQKLDSPTGDVTDAGAPEALNLELQSDTAGSAVPTGTSVAYRVVWGYKDANDNLILGAPSARLIYTATGGDKDPTLRAYIPVGQVTTAWFIQLYRSLSTATDPNDVLQLTLERNPSASDITNGYIDLQDSNTEDLLGAELYTNATQEGLINSNYQPPQCVDMALYQSYMFYANTETRYEFNVALLGQLTAGDTITIDSLVYTGGSSENAATRTFQVDSYSGYTAGQIVEATAKSLVRIINNAASGNTRIWASYTSTETDLPGKMRFYERDYGDAAAFTTVSSHGTKFSPQLTTAQAATNNKNPNRLYYSKFQEPEAVPVLNYFDVGPANDHILRILPLRNNLLIFTTQAIYQMTGTSETNFQVSLLDGTAKLLAPESLVPINNSACGLFDQGVARVTGGSVQIISRPIEGDLLSLRGAAGSKLSDLAFGIGYESDRKYLIALPTSSTDTINSLFYVYNMVTDAWTVFDLQKSAGIVRPSDDKLYLAQVGLVSRERKSFDSSDFADEALPVTATSVSIDKLTITLATAASARIGYLYYESSAKYSVITAVDSVNSTITVSDPLAWSTGAHSILPYISTTVVWNPATANSPNLLKQWAECALLVETPLQDATLSFSTSSNGGFEGVSIQDTADGPWGLFAWGGVPWGGDPFRKRYRTYVPRNKQRDVFIVVKLTQNTVFNSFEIAGLSFYYRPISNRTSM